MEVILGTLEGIKMKNIRCIYFEVMQNRDQIEGRGPMEAVSHFSELEAAVKDAKGRGVMGYGDGEVFEVIVEFLPEGKVKMGREEVYGYRKSRDGTWGYGYMDLRDDPDPQVDRDYAQYLRLKERFEGVL